MRFAAATHTRRERVLALFAAISMILSLMVVYAIPAGATDTNQTLHWVEVLEGDGYINVSCEKIDSESQTNYEADDDYTLVVVKKGSGPNENAVYWNVSSGDVLEPNQDGKPADASEWVGYSHVIVCNGELPNGPQPDLATATVTAACVEEDFAVNVTTSNATVGVDLDGQDGIEASEMGLTTGGYEVTASAGAMIDWQATANPGAEFEGVAPSGSITVLDCVEEEPEMGTVAIVKKADDDKAVNFTFQGDLSGSIAHDGIIEIDAEVGVAYSATEIMTEGWYLDKITCDSDGGQFDIDEALLSVSMTVTEDGGSVTCFFDNENLEDSEGAIIIRKLVTQGSDTEQEFTFVAEDFTLGDDMLAHGDQTSTDVNPGDYAVSEMVPEGWELVSEICESTDSGDESTPEDIDISANEIVTCTFTNAQLPVGVGSIEVTKTPSVPSVTAGDEVTFTITVENTSDVAVTIQEIVDSVYGEVAPVKASAVVSTNCVVPQDLAPDDGTDGSGDDFYSCQFVGVVDGELDAVHTNVVEVSGIDVSGADVSDTGSAEVVIDEVMGIVITPPEQPAGPVTPVTPDVDVEAEELPFTGIETERLLGLAIMLLGSGVLLLKWAPLREVDIIIETE